MSESNSVPNGFRKIPGFPRYAIDEYGTVISVCASGRGKDRSWGHAKRLNPVPSQDGYLRVYLSQDGKENTVYVHAMVLTTFVGPCPEGLQCRHLDGNPANNHVTNLAWGTRLENDRDKLLHGTKQLGEEVNGAKLKASDVLEIRRRAANGERKSDIAKDFPVNHTTISRIVLRKTWTHVDASETTKFFNDRHDARVAAGNQSLFND